MELFPPDLELAATRLVPLACPRCATTRLEPVGDGADSLFCRSCGQCWHESRSGLRAVDPVQCPGCVEHERSECLGLLGASFPRFGPPLD